MLHTQPQSPISNPQSPDLRPPSVVMQLDRLGALHQTRLSFVRTLVRRMMCEQWQIERSRFDLDGNGFGICIYTLTTLHDEQYSMIIFSHYLADEERTDRVIAEKWDVTAALYEGLITAERLAELQQEVPKQEAGRNRPDVLVLSRANKSTRNFTYFIECLANGRQPDPTVVAKVGYLLRTTAVYGNGKFGVADYAKVKVKKAFPTSFSAQMFTVYLIRQFSIDLVEHLAQQQAPTTAVPLHPDLQRYLGVGNATGLGMAPFLVKHPRLLHAWIQVREVALARVLATEATAVHLQKLQHLTQKAIIHFQETTTTHPRQAAQNEQLRQELPHFQQQIPNQPTPHCWQILVNWASQHTSLETQEVILSLLLEPYPDLVNDLENETGANEVLDLQPNMSISQLRQSIERRYQWALQYDFSQPHHQHYFWYRSLDKEEPRLGERLLEPGADQEMHLGIGRLVQQLYHQLQSTPTNQAVIYFLLQHPTYKGIVRRIQALDGYNYGEIHSNLLAADCLPIHMLRCKLAIFGASKFDPKSNLWVRITLFQGAPILSDIGRPFADDWCFPCQPDLL